jgi:succinate dehydrogenase hydrophobic anchor subunit
MKKIGAGTYWLLGFSAAVIALLVVFDFGRSVNIAAIALIAWAWLTRNHMILREWTSSAFGADNPREDQQRHYYSFSIKLLSEIKWLLYVIVFLLSALVHELWGQ